MSATWPGRAMHQTLPMPPTRRRDIDPLLSVGDVFTVAPHALPYTVTRLAETWSWCGWCVQATCAIPDSEGPVFYTLYLANEAITTPRAWGEPAYAPVTVIFRESRQLSFLEDVA